jgi:hypothetical protein
MLAVSGAARAQSASPPKAYIEGVAQSAFSNVTSQSYGAEGGLAMSPSWWFVVEGGLTRDVTTDAMSAAAQQIAASLSEAQPLAVTYQVKEPVTFVTVGLKYEMLAGGKAQPYVMLGGGVAQVKQDATFSVGGTDVTDNLQQYFVVLGTDLSAPSPSRCSHWGSASRRLKQLCSISSIDTAGSSSNQGISINRVGLGVGFRF